ncbi:MAG: BolA family protein [Mariprofundus sp.]|nr:BolA family protein [Mariprofundus sp.]
MSNTCEKIKEILETTFQPESLHIEDESWKHAGHAGAKEHGGGHFVVRISSNNFHGLARTQSHRMIFQALNSLFPKSIHALTIKIE